METLDQAGVEHEINFWKKFVISHRFLNDWCSLKKTNELNSKVYEFLKELSDNILVLDVGSGPVSLLRGTVKNIQTVDPLADLYKKIFDFKAAKIDPPLNIACEDLHELQSNQYNVVHMSNAIDHTKNPFKAFDQLWKCVKLGGYLIIQGHENEATHENWQGFHQWNISLSPEGLTIQDKESTNVIKHEGTEILNYRETLDTKRDWFIWILQK